VKRLFVAIDFPEEVNRQLIAICNGIESAKWIKPGQIHLTLRFIGEVSDEQAGLIKPALAQISAPGFTLQLKGVGTFPPADSNRWPRVLWVGLAPCPELTTLQARIEVTLQALGIPKDKHNFNAHVTLARFRKPPGKDLDKWLTRHQGIELEELSITQFHLIESRLTPNGAQHRVEQAFPLT
jgi:RNA 2',3'-cyclic 3'-phosphodiesterase